MAPGDAAAGVTRAALRLRPRPGEPGSGTEVWLPLLCSFDEDRGSAAGPPLLLPLGAGLGVVLPVATAPGAVALAKGVGVLGGSDALPPPPAAATAAAATGEADAAAAPAGVEAGGTEWGAEPRPRLPPVLPEESRSMLTVGWGLGGAGPAATRCPSRCARDGFAMAGVCCGGRASTGLMMAGTGVEAGGTGAGLGFECGVDVAVDWARR